MSNRNFALIGLCIIMFVIGITLLLHFKKSDAIKQKVSFSNRVRPNHDLAISIASSNKSKLKIDPAQISKNRESDVYNPEFMYLPDYMNRVQKHLRIKLYHQSPAKDTIECSQILNILSDYDLGIDAVFDAYSLVWEYHHETKLKIESIPDGEFKDMIIAQTHGRSVERFLNRYEIEDTQLIEELLQVSPKVFFGNVITDVGIQEGERLLVD